MLFAFGFRYVQAKHDHCPVAVAVAGVGSGVAKGEAEGVAEGVAGAGVAVGVGAGVGALATPSVSPAPICAPAPALAPATPATLSINVKRVLGNIAGTRKSKDTQESLICRLLTTYKYFLVEKQ